ncbi:uncharacterized protein LOC141611727 [Silene latifolia]|uniref:uncharacterized protein LOC141611727 n=1 Tax=Silene latifolia TaxID=37657 RepID=UPI003D785FC1
MANAGRGWTSTRISNIASRTFFFLIFLQIPLFRIPCRSGICTTPMHVTCSQLVASDIIPVGFVKTLIFPGAVVQGLVQSRTIPSWSSLEKIYNLTSAKDAPVVADLKRLEVLAGSYFSVAGALIGILKPGRMSMFGTLLIVWGLVKEGLLSRPANPDGAQSIYVYPSMLLALICAFASVKYDIKKAIRNQTARPVAKPLQSSSKSKLK